MTDYSPEERVFCVIGFTNPYGRAFGVYQGHFVADDSKGKTQVNLNGVIRVIPVADTYKSYQDASRAADRKNKEPNT